MMRVVQRTVPGEQTVSIYYVEKESLYQIRIIVHLADCIPYSIVYAIRLINRQLCSWEART